MTGSEGNDRERGGMTGSKGNDGERGGEGASHLVKLSLPDFYCLLLR